MEKTLSKRSLIIGCTIVLAALLALVAGCGNKDDTTTTASVTTTASASADTTSATGQSTGTTAAGTASTAAGVMTSDASGEQRFVVGGKSAQEYESELPALQKAVNASPKDLQALQALALAQYGLGKYADAAATYQKMLAVKEDAFTRNNYGNVLRDWGKGAEAKAAYEAAIKDDKTLVTPYINLYQWYLKQKNTDQALKVLDQGIAAVTSQADKTRLQDLKKKATTSTTLPSVPKSSATTAAHGTVTTAATTTSAK